MTTANPNLFLELIIRMLSTSLSQELPLSLIRDSLHPNAQKILDQYAKLHTQYAHMTPSDKKSQTQTAPTLI